MALRVFQGITGSAGQPAALAKGLRQFGVDAQSTLIGDNKFAYEADHIIDQSLTNWVAIGRYLSDIVDDYDIFHLHMRPFFYWHSNNFYFPSFLDLLTLKAAGKRICFHFRGSEVRKASLFKAENRFHYVDEDPDRLFAKFKETAQQEYISYISAFADRVFVTDPELQRYVPGSVVIPRYYYPAEVAQPRPLRDRNPVVLHAPSRRGIKGTDSIIAAVEQLKREGMTFEFKLIENLSNSETLKEIAQSDIVIDQLRIGWYGVLAVEGFALGRAVISYVRPDLVNSFGSGPVPIVNANPETITDVLRECIAEHDRRERAAHAGQRWFAQTHSTEAVVPLLISHYEDVLRSPKPVDVRAVQRLLECQAALAERSSWLSRLHPSLEMGLTKFKYVSETDGICAATKVAARHIYKKIFR